MKEVTKEQLQKQIISERITLSIHIICCLILIVGMTMNHVVMIANGGKMPVNWDVNYIDATHFTYQNESEIPYHYYADIYDLPNGIYSLGDLFMLFAVIVVIGYLIYQTYLLIKFIKIKYFSKKKKTKMNSKKKWGIWLMFLGLAAQLINIITYGLWGIDIDIFGAFVFIVGLIMTVINWSKNGKKK